MCANLSCIHIMILASICWSGTVKIKPIFVQHIVMFLNKAPVNFVLSSENYGFLSRSLWASFRAEAEVWGGPRGGKYHSCWRIFLSQDIFVWGYHILSSSCWHWYELGANGRKGVFGDAPRQKGAKDIQQIPSCPEICLVFWKNPVWFQILVSSNWRLSFFTRWRELADLRRPKILHFIQRWLRSRRSVDHFFATKP